MYPPIYRQTERRALNDAALDKMVAILQQQGTIVGMHPEGTRGQDGRSVQVPAGAARRRASSRCWRARRCCRCSSTALGNNFIEDVKANFTSAARSDRAVIAVFGPPVDYADLLAEKPRPTLYKKCADRFMAAIRVQSEREKLLRAELNAGKIDVAHDPRWITNRGKISPLYAKPG